MGWEGFFYWFKTNLTGRKQYVAVDGTFSTSRVVDSGFAQWSNLVGSLLFLLYLSLLSRASEILNFMNISNDTSVFLSQSNYNALYVSYNKELCTVSAWLRANRLSLNVDKTCHMIIRNKKNKGKRLRLLVFKYRDYWQS